MFTDSAWAATWLADKAVIEPQVGGKYELYWDSDSPAGYSTQGCRVTSYEEERLLSFTWRVPPHFGPQPVTSVTAFFTPERNGTTVHLLHSGWASDITWTYAQAMPDRASGSFALRPARQPNRAQIRQAQIWAASLAELAQSLSGAGRKHVLKLNYGRPGLSLAALVMAGK